MALIWLDKPHHHVKGGCLSGAVGAQKTNNFTRRDAEGNPVDNVSSSIGLSETLRNEVECFWAQGFSSG